MKTVTGRVFNSEPIPLSKAATLLSGFVSSENGANQAVRAYLRRASAAFTELKSIHREIKSSSVKEKNPISDAKREKNPTREPGRANGGDDLVGEKGKIRLQKSETFSEEISVHGREQDDVKDDKKRKKKSKKNKEEDTVDEKVKGKLESEQRNQERKEKEKKRKKMKSDGGLSTEERKSKKKRKSKEIDG